MKVLFAVSNENISESIIKKYQKEYKEIISSKNVYYFNAIQKELQKDNTYDRIVVSEDLEPFANNNYDAIDRFIFDKLDAISDEATNSTRNDTPIILICSDRRNKSEDMLVKLFSIGIYDAVLGNDRSIPQICNLIKKPRTKKEAKIYYKIDTDDVKYSPENENEVSEVEIQNILSHYKKLGKNEDKYAESFENIASQYSEEQLKVIANVLPLNVKAVLEMSSPTYQQIMTASVKGYINKNEDSGLSMNFIPDKTGPIGGNVVVPSAVNKATVKKISTSIEPSIQARIPGQEETTEAPKKRGRGRPRKNPLPDESVPKIPKKRGRPRKNPLPEQTEMPNSGVEENINLFDMPEQNTYIESDTNVLPGFEQYNDNTNQYDNNVVTENKQYYEENNESKQIVDTQSVNTNIQGLLTADKKLVSFVGTSKNGTSFIVNNVAETISNLGINTAILDATKNRNSYYIYTQNEEQLRNVAAESIRNLQSGMAQGIEVNKNLTVYTAIPDSNVGIKNYPEILETLLKNYDLVLIDCDFKTPIGYFAQSQEIYLVQSLDVLTIQSLTAFLRDLKAKDILAQDKIRIIINKDMKVRGLTDKAIIGGMSYYNEPAMSFMTELFNRDIVKYCTIPFETQTYSRYLEGLVNCKISTNGYSKAFMQALKNLNNMVYPLIGSKTNKKVKPKNKAKKMENNDQGAFSQGMSDTLNQMKNNF